MANITLSTTESNIVVDTTNDVITVNSTPTTVVVGESVAQVSNVDIRAALGNTAPILYNVSTGIFSFDSNAAFSGKTTDDLAEGSTNLYFTGARTVTAIENNFVILKGYKETVYNNGNLNGSITLDLALGSIHSVTMNGNITGISFNNLYAGSSATIILKQDAIGYRELITSSWSNWYFVGDNTQLILPANSINLLNVFYDGTNYYASLSDFESGSIPNSQLANSSLTVNGTSISLGSSGNISHFGALTTTNLSEGTNLYFTAARARGNVSATTASGIIYNSTTGVFSLASIPNSSLTNSAITINGTAVSLGGTRTLTTSDIAEGTNLYFTAARANSNVVSYIATVPLTVGGNLTVNGNINATGNINYQNVTDLYVTDQKITLNSNAATNANVEIISNRPTATNTMLKWNEQAARWEFTNNGTTYYPMATSTTDLVEGANLYFSNARVNAFIQDNITTTDIDEGTNLYYTTARANTAIADKLIDSSQKKAFNVAIKDLYLTPDAANATGGYYMPNIPGNVGDVLQLTGADQADWQRLDTGDVDEGTNLYFTAARARGNISAAENITYNSTTGVIGLANTLANVNGVSTETASNLTLATNKQVTITTRQLNNSVVNSANITGEGFALTAGGAFFDAPFFSYSGTGDLKTYVFDGSITEGSNTITISAIYDLQGVSANVSDVAQYYVYTDVPLSPEASSFPPGTYVTGVSGSTIYMSANATITDTFFYDGGDPYASYGALTAGARDNTTGLLIGFESDYDDGGTDAQLITYNWMTDYKSRYGYGANGPVTTNFAYSRGTASDYTIDTNISGQFLVGRTGFSSTKTVGNFRRGLTIGQADLTNRGENDGIQTFGLNVVWDGTEDPLENYGSNGIFPQMLLKQYTDGTSQGINGNTAVTWSGGGPRLMFIGAYGNANNPPLSTYARANQELGSIKWLSTTSFTTGPSTVGPPAYISAVSLKDQIVGPGDVGLYLVASPTTSGSSTSQVGGSTARALFVGHHKANTIISAASRTNGTCGDIMFTPARAASNRGNAAQMAEQVSTNVVGAPQWARIGYDNPSANTGARVEVTNGFNSAGARNGNLSVIINRNDNGVGFGNKAWAYKLQPGSNDLVLTEDNVIKTTFASGGNINLATNATINYDAVYGCFHNNSNITAAAADTVYAFEWPNVHINTNRVTVASNTQITVGQEGTYQFDLEMQAQNTGNADKDAYIWLAKNGTDIPETGVYVNLLKLWKQRIVKVWIVDGLAANDYIEVRFAVSDPTDIQLTAIPSQSSPYARPAVPSATITVTPVGA